MEIDIVGEDPVTQAIIERILKDYRPDLIVKNRLPARGGQIKSFAPKYNALGTPIMLLTDLDTMHCPPSLIKDWFGKTTELNNNFLFRVAHEEAESWLMADRVGFSKWLGIDINLIPTSKLIDKKKNISEIIFPIKPSLFMMLTLASTSKKQELKEHLTPKRGAGKGPGYNMALIPFIEQKWDIEAAALNSHSLSKMILRVQEFNKK